VERVSSFPSGAPGTSIAGSTIASAMEGSSPRWSASERNSARMKLTIFSDASEPSPSTGVAAPMVAPGRMYTLCAARAMSAPAEIARRFTKA
jgi:hypothetical protein